MYDCILSLTLRCLLTVIANRQVSMGKLLENNVPVFIISFNTQEVLLFRNAKTNEITVGSESKVEQCSYVAAITRVEEELDNELTGGWKVIDVSVSLFLCYNPDPKTCPDGKKICPSISIEYTPLCAPIFA